LESTRASIPLLEAQAQRSIHAIALLSGAQPSSVQAELSAPAEMPAAPPEVPVGLPSDLLRRRPDIRQAEREIAGSAARVGVAVSNLYPKFSLTGAAGGQSGTLLNVLSGAARLWSFGTSFSWGLLNYPATKANIQAAESREQQSMASYEKTVLTALKDVEDALASYTREKERQGSLAQAADANRKALELAQLRYDKGLSTFLDVLDAQRSLYSSEDAMTQSRGNVNTHLVALYKALGGGW
jgi:NodT family efflux transporter outer membrane factor (OMF) lipoprotein